MESIEQWDTKSYAEELAANVRAARARADISQQMLAARMRRLGFASWQHQTVGQIERGKRRITADEILGLALAMSTTIWDLMVAQPYDHLVALPGLREGYDTGPAADVIGARSVTNIAQGVWDRPIWWADEEIAARFIMSFSDTDRTDMTAQNRAFISRPPAEIGEEKP